eukprot:m.148271 g.148271  ORF g.148271 m.148271 type:complete len:506 (+) comp38492_c0_seq1:106-1623(+)
MESDNRCFRAAYLFDKVEDTAGQSAKEEKDALQQKILSKGDIQHIETTWLNLIIKNCGEMMAIIAVYVTDYKKLPAKLSFEKNFSRSIQQHGNRHNIRNGSIQQASALHISVRPSNCSAGGGGGGGGGDGDGDGGSDDDDDDDPAPESSGKSKKPRPKVGDRGRKWPGEDEQKSDDKNDNDNSHFPAEKIDFDSIHKGTKKFKKLLGEGSFGKVFRGRLYLQGKTIEVAVKKFKQRHGKPGDNKPDRDLQMKRQFSAEIRALAECRHPNIVRLLAYCADAPELCLVYELVPGGTLRVALSKSNPLPLSMKERLHIACDASHALNYLHTVLHVIIRDVKTSNMFLTSDRMVKLADFGLSLSLNGNCHHGRGGKEKKEKDEKEEEFWSSTCAGTKSYMSPEALKGLATTKVDVYSLGMVLYEIGTGLPPYSRSKSANLITYMKELDEESTDLSVMIDPKVSSLEEARKASLRLFSVAKVCTIMDHRERPSMSQIHCLLKEEFSTYTG